MPHRWSLPLLLALLLALVALPGGAGAQEAPDVIRGRVLGADSLPIEGATVTATSLVNGTSRSSRTGHDGRYTIVFAGGGGDYLMRVTAIGLLPVERRLRRDADEAVLVADSRLSRGPPQPDRGRVERERRQLPSREEAAEASVGEVERGAITGMISPADAGSLAALAASVPGVALTPGLDGGAAGFSVLGLGAEQNVVTLDGMRYASGDVPRGALAATRLSTSSFDPSRGGFSGAMLALQTYSGSNLVNRTLHLSVDQPGLQWTDRAGAQLGQRFSNVQLSGVASGPIRLDRAFYNASFQLGRRASELQTLLNTDAFSLERVGVARDSVVRLLDLLDRAGVPASVRSIPSSRETDAGSALARFDWSPSGTRTLGLTATGRWSSAGASLLGSTAVPAHGGDLITWGGQLQLSASTYVKALLFELRGSAQTSVQEGEPYVTLPNASVRVRSEFDDGRAGVQSLAFGGNSGLPRDSRTDGWQLMHAVSWITKDNAHRVRLTAEAQHDRYDQDQTTNALGTYAFNSLAELEANRPASFSRRLAPARRVGGATSSAFSLGDSWRLRPRIQLQYGLRLEGLHYEAVPRFNATLADTMGVRNDVVPNELTLSPRLGFTWSHGRAAGAPTQPRGTWRGGFGSFKNVPGSQLMANAVDQTGLASGAQQLQCIGGAVPPPDWRAYARDAGAIPTTCTGGTTGTAFSDANPNVTLFDPSYGAQRSWRANLGWTGPVLRSRLRLNAEGTLSWNVDQPTWLDLNFSGAPRFTLPGEGQRPVYVQPASIVASTGQIAARDARIARSFGTVASHRSDLRSLSRQLTVALSPARPTRTSWGLTYTLASTSDQLRGFGGSSAGDPLRVEWGRSSIAPHRLDWSLSRNVRDLVMVSLYGRTSAGTRYTPMVSGDVNGDGQGGNDRAFVFDPATLADSALAEGMHALLAGSTPAVRECLERQTGRVARRNSCANPWSTTMNLRVGVSSRALRLPRRTSVSLDFANPLVGLDALVHGPSRLHGWGQTPNAEQTLLYVRGFDPATQRFRYEVNPRFGDTRLARTGVRAPFQVTLSVRMALGPDPRRQNVVQLLGQGRDRRGSRLTEAQLRQRLGGLAAFDPMRQLVQQADSLGLEKEQLDSIGVLAVRFVVQADSIWAPVARRLASLPKSYDRDAAYEQVRDAQRTTWALLARYARASRDLLTPAQRRRLPLYLSSLLDERNLQALRDRTMGSFEGLEAIIAY